MNKRNTISLTAGITTALLVGGAVVAYLVGSAYSGIGLEANVSVPMSASSTMSVPSRLRIPLLGIDARVQLVGRTIAGAMATPNNFTDVGWYTGGPRPGEQGSAVITGHLDNALSLDGVFKRLGDLRIGDEVYVDTATGEHVLFRVIKIALYPYQKVPLNEVFSQTDGTYLNLITCAGTWLPKQRSYDHRLVVYTERAE